MVSTQAQRASSTRNRSTLYNRFRPIRFTPFRKGVANRLFM